MRKISYFLVSVIFLLMCFLFFSSVTRKETTEISIQSLTPTLGAAVQSNPSTFEFGNTTYAYDFFTVTNLSDLILIPNFSEKRTSGDIAEDNDCIHGVSGGFYDTSDEPLGGFMTDGVIRKDPVRNRLIDGFLWVKGEKAVISPDQPPSDARFYLQAGPLLLIDGGSTRISITNDEYRRRNVAAVAKTGNLSFLTIYDPESVYDGPLLSDLPSILMHLDSVLSLSLKDAINLDGGSASAFISKTKTLQEFSPIGSFFCVRSF